MGQPIIDAYNTERSQRWIGASLHHSVLDHPSLGERILRLEEVVEYKIPVKSSQPALRFAVHWCPYSSRAKASIEDMIFGTLKLEQDLPPTMFAPRPPKA
jgi:hypothetical protein